mgnify:CR=1 FL=1
MEQMNFGAASIEDMAMAQAIDAMEKSGDIAGLEAMKVGEESGSKTLTRIEDALARLNKEKQ